MSAIICGSLSCLLWLSYECSHNCFWGVGDVEFVSRNCIQRSRCNELHLHPDLIHMKRLQSLSQSCHGMRFGGFQEGFLHFAWIRKCTQRMDCGRLCLLKKEASTSSPHNAMQPFLLSNNTILKEAEWMFMRRGTNKVQHRGGCQTSEPSSQKFTQLLLVFLGTFTFHIILIMALPLETQLPC